MTEKMIIKWLLTGDVAIQYQVHRDLLGSERLSLRQKIAHEGWGAAFISRRAANGHWGRGFYQPKWTSTHYTILDLKNLDIPEDNPQIKDTLNVIFKNEKGWDGGIYPIGTGKISDVCLNGMVLNYSSYFRVGIENLKSVVDFILFQKMPDGGFNCHSNTSGAVHSSLHTTLSVAEGIHEYLKSGYKYRMSDLKNAELSCREFILQHRLFKSDKSGKIIDTKMIMLSYPSRWRYDILKALDYFRSAGVRHDSRMNDAIEIVLKKRRKDGRWPLQARHPGQTHFEMETCGTPSRWNTLRAMRILRHFRI